MVDGNINIGGIVLAISPDMKNYRGVK